MFRGALGIFRVCLLGAATGEREGKAPRYCSGLFIPNHPPTEPESSYLLISFCHYLGLLASHQPSDRWTAVGGELRATKNGKCHLLAHIGGQPDWKVSGRATREGNVDQEVNL